jgi:hypothetical protein
MFLVLLAASALRTAQHENGDDIALNLVGAFDDLEQFGITHVAGMEWSYQPPINLLTIHSVLRQSSPMAV